MALAPEFTVWSTDEQLRTPTKSRAQRGFLHGGQEMQGDFFTRLVTLNSLGPNANQKEPGEVFIRYECGGCDEIYDRESDAKQCCPPNKVWQCSVCRKVHNIEYAANACCPGIVSGQPMHCPICQKHADRFQVATDCCLHTHPTITAFGRWRISEMVKTGTPWSDAIAHNISH